MEVFLIILAVLLLAGGIIFSVLPPLPGPILSYVALVVTHYASSETEVSTFWLISLAIGMVAVTLLDYLMPAAATKKFGGTKAGVYGGLIGTLVGVFSGIPFGIIIGPLFGAIIGDLIGGNQIRAAVKSGFASFLGFVLATLLKVAYSIVVGLVMIWNVGGMIITSISELFN